MSRIGVLLDHPGIFCAWLIRPQNFRDWGKVLYPNPHHCSDGNFNLKRAMAVIRRRRCIALQFNFALCGVGGQHHALADLPSGETLFLLYRGLGGSLWRPGRMRKICSPHPTTGIRLPDRPTSRECLHRLSYFGQRLSIFFFSWRYNPHRGLYFTAL